MRVAAVTGPLTERQIGCVCRETLSGLSYLHSMAKMHRDVKVSGWRLPPTAGSAEHGSSVGFLHIIHTEAIDEGTSLDRNRNSIALFGL